MSHFGLICPPVTGHVQPIAAVGRALARRGHRVSFFHVPDVETRAHEEGLEFTGLGIDQFPPGTLPETVRKLSALSGRASLNFAIECACRVSEVILAHGPEAISRADVDALLVDQNEPAGATVAEHLQIPFVSVCTSLPLNRESLIPPPFVGWQYSASPFAALRNRIGYAISDHMIAPIQATLNGYRQRWGLKEIRIPDDSFSPIAQMVQMPREFDFPRKHLPATFHYLGPWFDSYSGSRVPFPFERLDGRPLIYGSIGTLQDRNSIFFRMMAEACAGLDAQLVLALGQKSGQTTEQFPGDPVVVNYAPQLELLRRAAVTITHAGMNTTQQSLHFGVPAVAIPLAHDQPAIAARLARTGAGITIPPKQVTTRRLRTAVSSLLAEGNPWRERARDLAEASRAAGGAEAAADLIETVKRK